MVTCKAENSKGIDQIEVKVLFTDIDEPFLITGLEPRDEIVTGDQVTIMCAASKYLFREIDWFLKNVPLVEMDGKMRI